MHSSKLLEECILWAVQNWKWSFVELAALGGHIYSTHSSQQVRLNIGALLDSSFMILASTNLEVCENVFHWIRRVVAKIPQQSRQVSEAAGGITKV